jgi:hypothetical protein
MPARRTALRLAVIGPSVVLFLLPEAPLQYRLRFLLALYLE